jgi:hypothetical protein
VTGRGGPVHTAEGSYSRVGKQGGPQLASNGRPGGGFRLHRITPSRGQSGSRVGMYHARYASGSLERQSSLPVAQAITI